MAAAHQDLDYPLYREIRIHGEDEFTVEEWDRAESREELAELEQDAIDFFGAESLRGHKTSTVKILPKKKKRTRKSSIEKELASIFAEISDGDSNAPPSLAIKSGDATSETTKKSGQPEAKPVAVAPVQSTAGINAASAQITTHNAALSTAEAKAEAAQEQETEQPKPDAAKKAGSRANAMVQMNSIEMSDDITAQLAAITAAADACLAGDNSALSQLEVQESVAEEPPQQPEEAVAKPAIIEKEIIVAEPICPKELRIREAIERHRKQRAQRSAETQENERRKMAQVLAELDARIQEMHTGKLAAVA